LKLIELLRVVLLLFIFVTISLKLNYITTKIIITSNFL